MTELDKLRNEIDEIDLKILNLVHQRLQLAVKIGSYKQEHNLKSFDSTRMSEVLQNWQQNARKLGISESLATSVYQLLHEHALMLEENERK